MGGIFAEAGGEPLAARDPDLRCLSTSGVGSEVDSDVREVVLLRDASHEILGVSAAPFCNLKTPTQELERGLFPVSQAEFLRVLFGYNISPFMLPGSSLGLAPQNG